MASQPSALADAVVEIERHMASRGWDQPPRLYALAPTEEVERRQPDLSGRLGSGALTPIEQDLPDKSLEDLLATITWPETVAGCALAVERIVLPPEAEESMPEDDEDAAVDWAQHHPERTDVRIVVGVLRDGSRASVLRVRDEGDDLIQDAELAPELGDALAQTLT